MKSLTRLTTLFYFTTIKIESLTNLTMQFYFTTIKMKSPTTLITLFYFIIFKINSLATLTALFYIVTTIKMKPLTTLPTLFYFTILKIKSLSTPTTLFKFTTINNKSHYRNYAAFIDQVLFFPPGTSMYVSVKCVCATVISPSGSAVESCMIFTKYSNFELFEIFVFQ